MRGFVVILALCALLVTPGKVQGQAGGTNTLEGVVTLVDARRGLFVIQNDGQATTLKPDDEMPRLQQGERISIEGQFVPYFSALPDYPSHPSGRILLPDFRAPTNWNDHFLARARGFLRVPADGDYTFWVMADDEAEVLLGANSDPATARLIASVRRGTWPPVWELDPEQKSQPVQLRAGERYYIEALQREWRGHDRLVVAWQGPNFERKVIGGSHLSPFGVEDGVTNGILYEYWTNCFMTRLATLSSGSREAAVARVSGARVQSLGAGQLPVARRVELDGKPSDGPDYSWSEVEGVVRFVAADDGVLTLEMESSDLRSTASNQRVTVKVLYWNGQPVTQLMNRKVRARGVWEKVRDTQGQATGGRLWVQDERQIWPLEFMDNDSLGMEALPMFDLTPANLNLAWGRKVLLRGTVMSYDQETGAALLRGEDSFYAYHSSDGKTWTPLGPPVPVAMSDAIFAGLVAASMTETQRMEATFSQLSMDASRSKSIALGGGQVRGSVALTNGSIALLPASGNDWDRADEGLFFCQPLQEEGEIVVRLESFNITRISDKTGLMLRESLDADAPYIALVMTHDKRLDLLYRQSRQGAAKIVARGNSETPQWLKLVRRRHQFAAQLMSGETLRVHQPVDLVGLLQWTNGNPLLTDAYERPAEKPRPAAPETGELREVPIAALPSATAESEQYMGQEYLIRGVVTFKDRAFGRDLLFLQDDSGATLMRASPVFFRSEQIEAGQRLEARGGVQFSPGVPPFRLNTATALGWGDLPQPLPYPNRSNAKLADSRWVETKGIVRAVTNNIMKVMGQNGLLSVWVGNLNSSNALTRYVDCLVTVRGVFSLQVASEPVLLVPTTSFIAVTEAAPDDPFIIPSFAINKVGASDANPDLQHRTKVIGVVTYRDEHSLVMQDQTGGARVEGSVSREVRVGDRVEVVGFPEWEGEAVTLRESVLRKTGNGQLPEPVEMMMEGLLSGRLNCWLVRLEGVVVDQKTRQGRQLLELQNGQRVFEAVLAEGAGQLKPLPVGSRVQVTGVTQLQFASPPARAARGRDYPLVATMDILMRTPADLVLLERPPWWTWRHTTAVGIFLVVVLAGAVGWIRALRRRVAQRTKELQETMGRLQKETELSATLAERERLAAEIHDTLEQGLSGIMMQLDGVDSRLANDSEGARQNLEMARRMVRFSRAEVRHTLWNLESQLLKDGDLRAAIQEIARQMSAGCSTMVTVEVSDTKFPLPAAVEHHLLRCSQEALSNALKHSGATNIRVELNYRADKVELVIADDGCGFDPDQILTGAGAHLGVRNLRSRARKMKGQLNIASQPTTGTTVRLTVPVTGRTERTPASTQ